MTILRKSSVIVLLWLVPAFALAVSKVTVPTSIQVVDEFGHTVVSAPSTSTEPVEKLVVFDIPQECGAALLRSEEGALPPLTIPMGHALSTRLESRYSSLRSLLGELSFAPFLSSSQDLALREYLSSSEMVLGTSSAALDCLTMLDKGVAARSGHEEHIRIERIRQIVEGVRYGIKSVDSLETLEPQTEEDALYSGDMLLGKHPSVTSLSIAKDRVDITFPLSVVLFGGWDTVARVRVVLDTNSEVDAPWWIALGSHRLSNIKRELAEIPHTTNDVPGMFQYAKDALKVISP